MRFRDLVLDELKDGMPVSVSQLALKLGCPEKKVRGGIDALRASGVPVWHDESRGAFWFADDLRPNPASSTKWKRPFKRESAAASSLFPSTSVKQGQKYNEKEIIGSSKPSSSSGPIMSAQTWSKLISAAQRASESGWARNEVFSPCVGESFIAGRIYFVGKAAGPLGKDVGWTLSQEECQNASYRWMVEFRNRRGFWRIVDAVDPSRRTIGWSNICKIDRADGNTPSLVEWKTIEEVSMTALSEELFTLGPKVTVMTIGYDHFRKSAENLLRLLGLTESVAPFEEKRDLHLVNGAQHVLLIGHPQFWSETRVEAVANYISTLA